MSVVLQTGVMYYRESQSDDWHPLILKVDTDLSALIEDYSQRAWDLGEYCHYTGLIYRCTTAITTPEVWDSTHWQETTIGEELKALNDEIIISDTQPTEQNNKLWVKETSSGDGVSIPTMGDIETALNPVSITAKKALIGKRAYIIGDSLNLRNDGGFGPHVLSISGMVGQSIGNGSSGFVRQGEGNKVFIDLLNTLISSLTEAEKNTTDYLIVMGGINDAYNGVSASAEKTAVQTFITTAKAAFPNAELVICPLNTFNWMTSAQYNVYAQIIDACRENGVSTTEDFLWWTLIDDYGIDSGDHVHPTSAGNAVLGGLIVNYLLGNSPLRTWNYELESDYGTIYSHTLTRKGRDMYCNVVVQMTSDITGTDKIVAHTSSAKRGIAMNGATLCSAGVYKNGSFYHIAGGVQRNPTTAELDKLRVRLYPYSNDSFAFNGSFVYFNGAWKIGISDGDNPFT